MADLRSHGRRRERRRRRARAVSIEQMTQMVRQVMGDSSLHILILN
jgi:hypothetical protein